MKKHLAATLRSDHASTVLRSRILGGVIEPGALLAESAVARDLGVSRVPVREVLFALERDGLVEFSQSGRAYVKELSPQDFEELYLLRVTLEPAAARLASPRLKADASLLGKNVEATRRAKCMEEVTRLDLDFHEIVLAASGNARLLKLWRSLRCELELWLGRLHRAKQMQTKGTLTETVASHLAIIDCFTRESPAACERLMRTHILGWREWLPTPEVGA